MVTARAYPRRETLTDDEKTQNGHLQRVVIHDRGDGSQHQRQSSTTLFSISLRPPQRGPIVNGQKTHRSR